MEIYIYIDTLQLLLDESLFLLLFMSAKEDFLFIYYETIECFKFRFM